MSDTQITPARGERLSNAQRKAVNTEKVKASIPRTASPELIARAARQAAKQEIAPPAPTVVWCRVLKKGDGQICMGVHVSGVGDAHYEKGERLQLPIETASVYEDRAWVEIEDAEGDDPAV